MLKRLLFTLLLLSAILPIPLQARDFQYTYEGQTLWYTVLDEKAKTCTTRFARSYGEPGNSVFGELILPSIVSDGNNEYTLTYIGDSAFYGCSGLTSINIPNSVTTIAGYAFYGCSSLTSINIPNSVIFILNDAFYGCTSLKSIKLSDSLGYINPSLFKNCTSLSSINIPPRVRGIGIFAFMGCSSLSSIIIPGSVKNIDGKAFSGCSNLTSISLPTSVNLINHNAFENCSELSEVIYTSNDCTWGQDIFLGCSKLKKFVITGDFSKITNVPNSADIYTFYECFNEAKQYSGNRKIITMPGIQTTSNSGLDEIIIKVMPDNGATFKGLFYQNEEIYAKNEEYTISGLMPYGIYSFTFLVTNEYFEELHFPKVFSTAELMNSISYDNKTQSTLSFNVDFSDDKRITNKKIYVKFKDFDLKEFNIDSNGKAKVTGLESNQTYSVYVSATFEGESYSCGSIEAKTLTVNPSISANLTPTTITLIPEITDKGDATISSENFMINDTEYTNKVQQFVNQPLYSRFSACYSVNNEQAEKTFTLPSLALKSMAARAASKDCAIICAETNMSEEEYGGGFEWRRYDAPDMVPSTFSPCPVANGHMEGRLRGLSMNTYYKYRPYYEDCNGQRTFGEWTAFITADADVYFEPTVYTYAPNSITKNSATVVGYAMGGSEDVDEQGFEFWATSQSRATTDIRRVLATGQRMTATLEDLEPGTHYTVRAFATTKAKTTYGDNQEFETDGESESAIEPITADETEVQPFDIYTLSGVCVRRHTTDMSGLAPGLYIANGKKILVH